MTREEAIYRLKNMAWLYGSAEREQNIEAIDMAIEALQNRSQGEWIYQSKFGRIECKACGHVFRSYVYPRNFCPNCGAIMKGGEE